MQNLNLILKIYAVFLSLVLAVSADEVWIEILHTTDIHGHVFSAGLTDPDLVSGGLLRCASLIERVRDRNPNALLLDCGDVFQGTAESYLTRGLLVAQIVKRLRYNALVVGNHEFDWGSEALWNFYRTAETPVLAADIFYPAAQTLPPGSLWSAAPPLQLRPAVIQPFLLFEIERVRVVVVGLSNPHMPHWFKPAVLDNLVFFDSVETLRGLMPRLRLLKPDILILAVHQGYRTWGDNPANNINRIAANFPELTVILGAHSHAAIEAAEINGILYSQTAPHGRGVGHVRIKFDTQKRRILKRQAKILPAEANIPFSENLGQDFLANQKTTEVYLNAQVGIAACEHNASEITPGQSRIQSLLAAAIAEKTGADLVFHGTLAAAAILPGPVTMRDVWRVVPYENTIGLAKLTEEEIKAILIENSKFVKTAQFRGVWGLTYQLSLEPAPAVDKLNFNCPKAKGKRYTVAFNSFDLASAGGRLPELRQITSEPRSNLQDTGLETRQILVDYLAKHLNFDILHIPPRAGAVLLND